MRLRSLCFFVATLPLGAIASAASATDPDPLAAPHGAPVDPSSAIDTAAAQRAMHAALGTSSSLPPGILPDPKLLDGSTQAAEKKPAYGMLGEFEIPGDDNGSQNDSSKQQQQQQQQGGGGGNKSQDQKSQQSSGGSQSQSGQQGGSGGSQSGQQGGGGGGQSQSGGQQGQQGGGGGSQSQSGQQGGGGGSSDKIDQAAGGGGDDSADASQSGGGQSGGKSGSGSRSASRSGSKSSRGGGTGGSVAQNDPNATADGAESSGLSAKEGGELASQSDGLPPKPGEQKIGDATMQIKQQAPASSIVGVQQPAGKEVPQEYGRMAAGQPQSNTNVNRGVEKGQTMPTGL